ncbi:unnamed protein product [Alopecurus aequalis]
MKSSSGGGHVVGVPVTSTAYGIEEKVSTRDQSFRKVDGDHLAVSLTHPSPYTSFGYKHSTKGQVVHWVSKLSRRAQGFREHGEYALSIVYVPSVVSTACGREPHSKPIYGSPYAVTLGPKISETVKGKLSLGAKILQAGGIERVFRKAFPAEKGERLVKALQCYLYTTGGPIAGMLFVSTKKVAFRSDRPVTVTSPKGDVARVSYKVVVPLKRIGKVRPSENVDKPDEKYIHVATVDGFEFWFMGFVSYQRSCKYMQQVICSELQ